MKSKNIPADIKTKSIKEAQNEIQDIISYLEQYNYLIYVENDDIYAIK